MIFQARSGFVSHDTAMRLDRTAHAKQRAYIRGFYAEARTLKIDLGQPHCPYGILDDPTVTAGGAFDLGRADARDAARGRGAA